MSNTSPSDEDKTAAGQRVVGDAFRTVIYATFAAIFVMGAVMAPVLLPAEKSTEAAIFSALGAAYFAFRSWMSSRKPG